MKNDKRIIFIGGIPGVGKTSISGYLAKTLNIDIVLSGDYLREFLRPMFPKDHILQHSVYDAWRPYGDSSRENVETGFREQTKIISKGFNSMFKRAVDNGESLILESLYFLPSMIDEAYRDNIFMIYLFVEKSERNAEKLMERTKFTHSSSPGNRLVEQLPRYRIIMEISMDECNSYGIPVFDTTEYDSARTKIYRYIMERNSI